MKTYKIVIHATAYTRYLTRSTRTWSLVYTTWWRNIYFRALNDFDFIVCYRNVVVCNKFCRTILYYVNKLRVTYVYGFPPPPNHLIVRISYYKSSFTYSRYCRNSLQVFGGRAVWLPLSWTHKHKTCIPTILRLNYVTFTMNLCLCMQTITFLTVLFSHFIID